MYILFLSGDDWVGLSIWKVWIDGGCLDILPQATWHLYNSGWTEQQGHEQVDQEEVLLFLFFFYILGLLELLHTILSS